MYLIIPTRRTRDAPESWYNCGRSSSGRSSSGISSAIRMTFAPVVELFRRTSYRQRLFKAVNPERRGRALPRISILRSLLPILKRKSWPIKVRLGQSRTKLYRKKSSTWSSRRRIIVSWRRVPMKVSLCAYSDPGRLLKAFHSNQNFESRHRRSYYSRRRHLPSRYPPPLAPSVWG